LDDAVAKLREVTEAEPCSAEQTVDGQTIRMGPPQDATLLFQLIENMSAAASRRDAVTQMVELLASQCGDCHVRCGLGRGRLTHFFDSRLGWLGPESSLHQQVSEQWESPQQRADDPEQDVASCIRRGRTIELYCPQPDGSGRCSVTIEGDQIDTRVFQWLQPAATTIGSVLWSRPTRSWPSIVIRMARRTSIMLAVAAVVVLLLGLWPVHYRVACTARVETTQQRMVATPFEATLLHANFKPGDTVKTGDILVELDGRPLRLEREAIEAEIQQVSKEHDVALATRRIADAQQAALKKQQLSRQYELISQRLGQLKVVSPIDGVVVSGDLERFVGSPLERGQTLIEVAPLDKLIIEVEIPEHEIGYVSKGADTRIKIDAIGGKSIRLPLEEVYPSAELRDDRNVFIGRIHIDNADQELKPGMRGEGTTYGPLRPWIWSWMRGGFERTLWWVGY
jgi:biotin carboxyl carrier protein